MEHPIIPFRVYFKVFLVLVAFTVVTVLAPLLDLGIFAAFIALLIASIKAFFVMAYFMHLKYETGINRLIFGSSFFFLFLLLLFCVTDILSRVSVENTL